jgi:hypothetical protein
MRIVLLLILIVGCEVFQGGNPVPKTTLTAREFVDVYVALSRAARPEDKARVLRQHKTTEKELRAFVRAYSRNLAAFSTVFDSIVARQGAELESDIPALPRP